MAGEPSRNGAEIDKFLGAARGSACAQLAAAAVEQQREVSPTARSGAPAAMGRVDNRSDR
jgi:hypothetical protein